MDKFDVMGITHRGSNNTRVFNDDIDFNSVYNIIKSTLNK